MVEVTRSRPTPTASARTATAKRAETRRRVLAATIEMVAEQGISGASAAAIAERSGLSWGVIQYHFGDRLGLFVAAFAEAIDRFERGQRDAMADLGDWLGDRVDSLLARSWSQMTSPGYLGLLEIQLLLRREPAAAEQYRAGALKASIAARDAWRSTFPELEAGRVDRAQELALASLRGLAVSHALGTPTSASARTRRELNAATLAILSADD
jgi:AcrR family transcriptional regulator